MNPTQLFQFHYGTIKSCESESGNGLFNYFNSTMVRLKETHSDAGLPLHGFQFHYGTIKRHFMHIKEGQLGISIPLWYD